MTLAEITKPRKEKVFFKNQKWDEKNLCWSEIHIIYNTEEEATRAAAKLENTRTVKRTDYGWRGV